MNGGKYTKNYNRTNLSFHIFSWYEGSHPFGPSHNNSIEGINRSIKENQTFRLKLPLGELFNVSLRLVREMSKESDEVLFKPRSYVIEKDDNGKYNLPDSLKLKTKGYQWFMQNSSAASGKILKVKNPETKYTVLNDFNLGPLDGLWAVSSSSTDGSRLQERAKERFVQRGVPLVAMKRLEQAAGL